MTQKLGTAFADLADGGPFAAAAAEVARRIGAQGISSRALLGGMRLIDESSRLTGQYQDPNYLPMYYHMGRVFDPKRVLCVGLNLGLHVSCLLRGCRSPESAVCVESPSESFYSPRLAVSNIKSAAGRRFPVRVHVGDLHDPSLANSCRGTDMAAVTYEMGSDELMHCMDFCWASLSNGGVMCVDRLSHKDSRAVFDDFCRAKGASPFFLATRYGSGIVER